MAVKPEIVSQNGTSCLKGAYHGYFVKVTAGYGISDDIHVLRYFLSAVLRIELYLEQVLLSYILVASCLFSFEMGFYEVVQMDLEFIL